MATKKRVYTINAFGECVPAATYSCLLTLCQEWGLVDHYSAINKYLKKHEEPYEDSRYIIKKHFLIKSKYTKK